MIITDCGLKGIPVQTRMYVSLSNVLQEIEYQLTDARCPEYWDINDNIAYQQAKDFLFSIRLEMAFVCEASAWYYSAC